jgi:undecaprenyl-diphosphatase
MMPHHSIDDTETNKSPRLCAGQKMMYAAPYMFVAALNFILNIDKQLFILINSSWSTGWGDLFFPLITDVHKTMAFKLLVVPALLSSFVWSRGLKKGLMIFAFCAVSIMVSDGVGNFMFKKTIQRPRPAQTEGLQVQVRSPFGGYSFVSNHATNMFNFAAFTSAIFPVATLPTYFLAFVIAYSRVYNGVHFPADVLVGGLLGLLVGLIFAKLCKSSLVRTEKNNASQKRTNL